MIYPTLDGKTVQLGDFLCYAPGNAQALEAITEDGSRVKGWNPDGSLIYLAWAGVVPLSACTWADPSKVLPSQKLYAAPSSNRWDDAVNWGLLQIAIARGIGI